MKVRSAIAALPIGTSSSSRSFGQHEAADMLRQVARKAEQPVGQPPRAAMQNGIVGIEPGLPHPLRDGRPSPQLPQTCRRAARSRPRSAQRLADLADRAARAVVDHGGGDAGALAAIAA
jgi:hypothetical protein